MTTTHERPRSAGFALAHQLGETAHIPHLGAPSDRSCVRLAYSVREAAQIANLGRSTIYKALAEGNLTARKAYGRTLILHDDLEAFLKGLPSLVQTSGAPAHNGTQNEPHSEESEK
jgi:excisionase family DNA binding protein